MTSVISEVEETRISDDERSYTVFVSHPRLGKLSVSITRSTKSEVESAAYTLAKEWDNEYEEYCRERDTQRSNGGVGLER